MKLLLSTLLAFFLLQYSNAQFKIKEDATTISFIYKSNDVNGTIAGFSSSSILDFENIERTKIKGSVQSKTLKTGNSIRDWSLKRNKYFNADDYPKITFESTKVYKEGANIIVNGNLKIKKVSKTVTWTFKLSDKKLVGTTTLFSSDFGISIKKERADNEVDVTLTAYLE